MGDVISENRCNIPAICRIPGRGTGFLIAPGLIMTGLSVVPSKPEAAKLKAVFYEGGKQASVAVELKPFKTFFVSAFPEHLAYAIVACDTRGIHNARPVKLPMIDNEWDDVEEGDICLIVQHPTAINSNEEKDGAEVRRFEDVIKKRDGLIYFKENRKYNCAGCPVFNSRGTLIGLYAQDNCEAAENSGVSACAVDIREIVRHLFANCKMGLFECTSSPRDIWRTWYQDGDISRALRVMQNFQHTEIVQMAIRELCRFSGDDARMREIMANNGVKVILENLHKFRIDEQVVCSSFRTLWDLSFGDDSRRKEIVAHGGISIVIQGMDKFYRNEEVVEYGCVLLFNLSSLPEHVTSILCESGIPIVIKAVEMYPKSEVIIKFTLGVLMNIAKNTKDDAHVERIVQLGGIERACAALTEFCHNEYLIENCVLLLSAVASHRNFAVHAALRSSVIPLINALKSHSSNKTMAKHGNQALWYLGLDPTNRVAIIRNGGLEVLDGTIDAVAQTLGA